MRESTIRILNNYFLNFPRLFLTEQEIQLLLAREFQNSGDYDQIHVEYYVANHLIPANPFAGHFYIDLVLEKDGQYLPIEIKYKTAATVLHMNVFGGAAPVALLQQGAQNLGCYGFWKDVKRLELIHQAFENVEQGISLFITNDAFYLQPPLNNHVGYEPFSVHDGKAVAAGTLLNWNGNLRIAQAHPGFQIEANYQINWQQGIAEPALNFMMV